MSLRQQRRQQLVRADDDQSLLLRFVPLRLFISHHLPRFLVVRDGLDKGAHRHAPHTDKTHEGTAKPSSKDASSGGGGGDDPTKTGEGGSSATNDSPPSASASSTGGGGSGGGSAGSALADDSLKGHNDFRATHHADALTWNETLVEAAGRWVENCVWEHSGGSLLPGTTYGENLFMTSSSANNQDSTSNVVDAVNSWNSEESMYDYNNPGFTHDTGHFTQTVWVGTKSVGCAMGTCMGLMSSGEWAIYYVCEYYPAGNWEGQFPENVLPP
ncbi:hypothetical protein JCM10449v2_003329 [Rhodotorula kratochvilovae]